MSNDSKHPTTLAFYPNAHGFGYALFDGPTEPLDCGVIKVRPISNQGCLRRIKVCITTMRPELVIIQGLEGLRSWKTKRVKALLESIVTYAQSQNIPVHRYTREHIQAVFSQFKAETKYEIAKCIAKLLPAYQKRLPKPRQFWMPELYMMGMFDAMSLALTHYLQ